ncbi:MAG TPA: antibiotic biosynthesis monooxygenase [Ktedonobacterales bacterium]|jgi:heme-degrading monooxygenase HmoA
MSRTITRFKVKDFDTFKHAFAQGVALRQAHGGQGAQLFHNSSDPHDVLLIIEWTNLEQARAFLGSGELRQRQQEAGVLGPPELYDEVESYPA